MEEVQVERLEGDCREDWCKECESCQKIIYQKSETKSSESHTYKNLRQEMKTDGFGIFPEMVRISDEKRNGRRDAFLTFMIEA